MKIKRINIILISSSFLIAFLISLFFVSFRSYTESDFITYISLFKSFPSFIPYQLQEAGFWLFHGLLHN